MMTHYFIRDNNKGLLFRDCKTKKALNGGA